MGVTSWVDGSETSYVSISSPTTQLLSANGTLAIPDLQMKMNSAYMTYTYRYQLKRVDVYQDSTKIAEIKTNESTTAVAKNVYCALTGWDTKPTLTVSNLFTGSNSTTRTIPFYLKTSSNTSLQARYTQDGGGASNRSPSGVLTLATINVTLDAPPTFTASAVSCDIYPAYANLTTASVTISSASAQYGGTITASSFTIGNQTVTGSGNGTLSIALDSVGEFTPIVTVTDSRGQVTTKTLTKITVNGYVEPSANNVSVERTDTSGVADDEGKCAVITADITWSSAIADLTAPTVVVKDLDGNTQTSTTTWYTSRDGSGVSSAISDWSQIVSADMPIYGLVDNTGHNLFNTQYSYTVAVTPNDDIPQSGATVTRTLGSAFYTVDFLAGGHGIAFGQPASQTGFYVNMDTHLLQGADITGNVTTSGTTETLDAYIDIPDYSTSGTDKAIYDALVSLGWDSDVAPNDTPMSLKELLSKLVNIVNTPMVVEQGTSGIWTYRKWSDGTAEVWGEKSWSITGWTSWGSTYYSTSTGTIAYPTFNGTSIFTAKPTVTADGHTATGDTWLAGSGGSLAGTKDATASYFMMRASSGSSTTGYVHIHAIGKWK